MSNIQYSPLKNKKKCIEYPQLHDINRFFSSNIESSTFNERTNNSKSFPVADYIPSIKS